MTKITAIVAASIALTALVFLSSAYCDETTTAESDQAMTEPPIGQEFLAQLIGKWRGDCRTWFQPNRLADESPIEGEITQAFGDNFVRHHYASAIQGKPRKGEELIAFNRITKKFQTTWVDDFHMNYAIMFSQGDGIAKGFSVSGEYDVAPEEEPWGWRTDYVLEDPNHMTITAFNIHPTGEEVRAIEIKYERQR